MILLAQREGGRRRADGAAFHRLLDRDAGLRIAAGFEAGAAPRRAFFCEVRAPCFFTTSAWAVEKLSQKNYVTYAWPSGVCRGNCHGDALVHLPRPPPTPVLVASVPRRHLATATSPTATT